MVAWAWQSLARRLARRLGLPVLLLGLLGFFPAWGRADGPAKDGMFLSVPSHFTDSAVDLMKAQVKDAILRQKRPISVVVFDFNPHGLPSGSSDFHACNRLNDFIRQLQRGQIEKYPPIKTVAFVQNEVSRHTLLPVFACKELVMSTNGKLGQVLPDPGEALTASAREAYKEVAQQWAPSQDLVFKLLDKNMAIVRVAGKDGVRYVNKADYDLDQGAVGEKIFPGEMTVVAELGPGLTIIDSKLARQLELCKRIINTREQVAQAYDLPPLALREDPLAGRNTKAFRIDVRSPFNKARLDSLERRVKAAIGRGGNFLFLNLDCEGGDTVDVASTARFLRTLKDDSDGLPVKTVAYVPKGRALGAATFLAVACSEIVMADDAVLGDFEYLKEAKNLDAPREMLVKLAREQGYPEPLFQATLEGGFAKINARTAREWGIARFDDVNDLTDLYAHYKELGVEPARVIGSRDDWLDQVAEFFRDPIVNVILIIVGIIGLILELKMPGVTFPGILAAICFVLFFWAHSFVGQFTMLAILLFVLGLFLVGLEIFVIPGFGVTGISGVLLVVASLVLVTLERMPQSSSDWISLGGTLTTYGMSLIGALIGAFIIAWYLPSIPYANRLVLKPPEDEIASSPGARDGGLETRAALLGAMGVAATTLRPAGKAQFGDDYLDVVAEGDYVEPGVRVQVIEIEGNRIVVKAV